MAAATVSENVRQRIAIAAVCGNTKAETARLLGIDRATVAKYWPDSIGTDPRPIASPSPSPSAALPVANHEAETVDLGGLPESDAEDFEAFPLLDTPGRWLVLCDVHLPYHDRKTLELAAGEAKRRGIAGVLLNGDTLDSHEISNHDKDPRAPRYREEIAKGREFLAWVRGQFPAARVVYKQGNHEDRLERYIGQHAPALNGIEGVDLPSFLHFADYGVEWVADKRVIWAGKLAVVHGHEWKGGGGGVNPARWLYLRARYVAMCGHFHRTSFHGEGRNIRGKTEAAWSVGCACHLSPKYMPLNAWNHGFAFVEFQSDGQFQVSNLRVREGRIE